ncbi:hypothetical protein L2E82_48252 [Cichorium intybus]|uniref:Uncharacterized protein n=1 Tax=Cichorium intybus TaxID=13427 RepID=A0ACB8YYT9_CICIN|nr:hypothetical protein L2E82_48252 [Cichorium intybus]
MRKTCLNKRHEISKTLEKIRRRIGKVTAFLLPERRKNIDCFRSHQKTLSIFPNPQDPSKSLNQLQGF